MKRLPDISKGAHTDFAVVLARVLSEDSRIKIKFGGKTEVDTALTEIAFILCRVERDLHIFILALSEFS
jgi:hypothetical protein